MRKARRLDQKIGGVIRGLLCWPFAGILAVLGIRFAMISNPGRIGHMAAEVDAFLKERELGLIPAERPILLIDRRKCGNPALLDVFRQNMRVWDRRWQRRLLSELSKIQAVRLPLGRSIVGMGESARYQEINWLWRDRPPAVQLTPEIEEKGRACLREMGVEDGAWFVTVHAREGGYSPSDEQHHAHRNARIQTYFPAFDAIIAAGGRVIRIGDATMEPLPDMDGVIDYANSSFKSDWMDLWLCTHNRFLLGTTSGLAMVTTMMGRPCALTNMIPAGAAFGMGPNDISIPKRLQRGGVDVHLSDVFREDLASVRYAWIFEQKGVSIVDNSEQEIRALTEEMLARLSGQFEVTSADEDLQRRIRGMLRPNDYCFGATSRIGRDWLRQHRHLLEE